MQRRSVVKAAAAAAVAAALPAFAQDGAFPNRPIKLLVGFTPGGATDSIARLLADQLRSRLGQPVIVDNKPGQGGSLALATLAQSAPDGHTLAITGMASLVVNPHLYASVRYKTLDDFAAVGMVADLPMLLVANPSAPFSTVPEMVAFAKANPGKLQFPSHGYGTLSHLSMELLKRTAGIDLLHVPYQGSAPALTALIAGTVNVALDTAIATQPHITAKKLKVIATSSERRLPALPEVPSIAESGMPGFSATPWLAIVAPRNSPDSVTVRLNAAVRSVVQDSAVQARFRALGTVPRESSREDLAALIRSDYKIWGDVVRESGVRVE